MMLYQLNVESTVDPSVFPAAVRKMRGPVEALAHATSAHQKVEPLVLEYSWVRYRGLWAERECHHNFRYIVLWPILRLLALWAAIKYHVYQICVRPTQIERRLLGPRKWLLAFDQLHPLLYLVRNGVTSWTALASIYAAPIVLKNDTGWRAALARFWFDQPEAQAVRNRLLQVYDEVYNHLVAVHELGVMNIKIASLACGSALAVIEAIAEFLSVNHKVSITLDLVDLNVDSLDLARQLAENRGVITSIATHAMDVREFLSRSRSEAFDIVEMSGFLDYRHDESLVRNCAGASGLLANGGIFIAAQIGPRWTSFMTRWITGWPLLIRRSRSRFSELLRQGLSWNGDLYHMRVITEPQGIYHVAVVTNVGQV